MSQRSIATRTDGYKFTHYRQYPPETTGVYSYFESRLPAQDICFFGLQEILKKHFVGRVIDKERVAYAERRVNQYLGGGAAFNRSGWNHIGEAHGGLLPLHIKAVPEGLVVPSGNVLMTVENTDPFVPWLTNFVETLLMQVWYPTSVATHGRDFRKMLADWGDRTGAPEGWLDYSLHDFGFRGVSSVESAGIGGVAHLVNFRGTDTFEAIEDAADFYREEMAGTTIPAAEHSTITSWGEAHEVDAYRNMLRQFPTGLVAVVSDSYDIINACRLWGTVLRDEVLGRDGRLVIRPDSGKPWEVVTEVLQVLWDYFGGTLNDKGYRVLETHVRVIQGDGVNARSAAQVLEWITAAGFSVENVVFGMGGALLQKLDRDLYDFAFKCSSCVVEGERRDVFKNPRHMPTKASKRGRLKLIRRDGTYATVLADECPDDPDVLQDVFLNGELLIDQSLDQIRIRAAI